MRTAHGGLRITDANWEATVKHLSAALDSAKVGQREKQELLAVVGTLKKDIVAKP
jgi:hemoglobin